MKTRLSVTNGFDADLRRTNLAVVNSSSGLLTSTAYGYDNASRLATVSDGVNTSAYGYLANSSLVGQITNRHSGAIRMTTTKAYDYLNRLTQISSASSAAYTLPVTFNYQYNTANQRKTNVLADGSYWVYGYDALGQVTNGCKHFADGTPVAGQQFDYAFDTIGNRTQTRTGGDQTGTNNLRLANYYANNLNQLTNRDVPPYVDIKGASLYTNAVTVNGQTAYRKGEYFRKELGVNNTNSALWTNIVVAGGQSISGNVYVAQQPETFLYDADGNLTNDGRWAYVWDAENRLIEMTNNTSVGPNYDLKFAYDAKGRRIQKVVATNGVAYSTNNFLYDGWNLVSILNPQSSILATFTWGSDLSGSLQGAGGVGGLLWSQSFTNNTTQSVSFYAYDGNGNVAALVNALDGTTSANNEYGPFGETIRMTGTAAKNNPLRFSTKYQDDESDLLYYSYRYYKASTGNWPSRDPMDELSFQADYNKRASPTDMLRIRKMLSGSSYLLVKNDPLDQVDMLGLCPRNTCDNWEITIVSQVSVDYVGGPLGVHAELRASPKCCMDKYFAPQYNYVGGGLGVGIDATININVGAKKFTTPCIGWYSHVGFGRVTGVGVGVIITYGLTYYTTPQAYFSIASPSWGIDASIFSNVGGWNLYPENGPGTELQ